MSNANERLKATLARVEQIKNQNKSRERREMEAKRKKDAHRNFIIGELVCKYFPDMMKYQPKRSKVDNTSEFADFENFLCWLSDKTDLVEAIKKDFHLSSMN